MELDVAIPTYDDSYASALATLPKYLQPNYLSEAGDAIFTITSADAVGNARFGGGDSFTLKVLRHISTGAVQDGSSSQIILSLDASSDDNCGWHRIHE